MVELYKRRDEIGFLRRLRLNSSRGGRSGRVRSGLSKVEALVEADTTVRWKRWVAKKWAGRAFLLNAINRGGRRACVSASRRLGDTALPCLQALPPARKVLGSCVLVAPTWLSSDARILLRRMHGWSSEQSRLVSVYEPSNGQGPDWPIGFAKKRARREKIVRQIV